MRPEQNIYLTTEELTALSNPNELSKGALRRALRVISSKATAELREREQAIPIVIMK